MKVGRFVTQLGCYAIGAVLCMSFSSSRAMAQDHDRFAGFFAGADEYLVKPVSPLELVQTIRRAIERTVADRRQRFRALLTDTETLPPEE